MSRISAPWPPTAGNCYLMSSSNAGGPAPSLKCTVCDAVMVEWGGTKLWFAELVSRPQR